MLNRKSTEYIENFLQKNQYKMEFPSSFYGREPNSVIKDWDSAKLKVCMMSAWSYTNVPGNQTIPLMTKLINESGEDIFCDRSFFPSDKKDLKLFVNGGIPIFGLNSRRSLADFDLIGTSLGFVLFYPNVLKQMRMCGFPVYREDRDKSEEKMPIFIAGGPTYGNPEVWAPVMDLIWLGEAEDEEGSPGISAFCNRLRDYIETVKADTWVEKKDYIVKKLCEEFDFLYAPKFHKPIVDKDTKLITGFDYSGMKKPKRKFVKDFDSVTGFDNPPIAYVDTGMGPGEVEGARGCPGSCAFCAIGFRYRPYRERSVDRIVSIIKENYKNSGAIEAFPCFFDFSSYKQKKLLVKRLLEEVSSNVDTQGGRVDNVAADTDFAAMAQLGKMDQLAMGIEGCSQRLRDMLNKNASVTDILSVFEFAMKRGFKRIKVYMVCDIMYENDEDDLCFINLMKKVAEMRDSMGVNVKINVSFTPLRTEANTPLQWFETSTYKKQVGGIPVALKSLGFRVQYGAKLNINRTHFFQLFNLADRTAAECIIDSCLALDACYWGGAGDKNFYEDMKKRLEEKGLSYNHYFCAKPKDYIFGWDIVDMGVSKEYLWQFYEKMVKLMEDNPNALQYEKDCISSGKSFPVMTKCTEHSLCKCCDKECLIIQGKQNRLVDEDVDLSKVKIVNDDSAIDKALFRVFIDSSKRFCDNEFWEYTLRRAFYLAGFPIAKNNIVFGSNSIQFRNWLSGVDYVEIGTLEPFDAVNWNLDSLNRNLVDFGIQLISYCRVGTAFDIRRSMKDSLSMYKMPVVKSKYEILDALKRFNKQDFIEMRLRKDEYQRGRQSKVVNMKDFCYRAWAVFQGKDPKFYSLLRGGCSPFDIYSSIFGGSSSEALAQLAERVEVFSSSFLDQASVSGENCKVCGKAIPLNLFGDLLSKEYCAEHMKGL